MKKKVFISYSHNDVDIYDMEKLKEKLEEDNYEVLIDFELKKENPALTSFMESGIREANFILTICTPEYKERANNREKNSTGVGYESRLLASHVYNKTKIVIPILYSGSIKSSVPDFLKDFEVIFLEKNITNEDYSLKYFELLKKLGKIEFNLETKKYLNDLEILSNSHSQKETLLLDDIFIYPTLSYIGKSKTSNTKKHKDNKNEPSIISLNSANIKSRIIDEKFILISGDNQSGKTTLSKKITIDLFKDNFFPLLINTPEKINNFNTLIEKEIKRQYINLKNNIETVREKLVLIFDDFHFLKNTDNFFENIYKFKYVILFVDDIYNINWKKSEDSNLFYKYSISFFGAKLRNKLIYKWVNINNEYLNENEEFQKVDQKTELINSILGKGIMPSYPFFILSILSSSETLKEELDSNITSQGHCYQALIYIYLRRANVKNTDIHMYINFLSEIAYYIFKSGFYELDDTDYKNFISKYKTKFLLSEEELIFKKLKKADLLNITSLGNVKFSYPYIYYYFLGKYFSEHYKEKKKEIETIISNLHVDRNSYICIFISHHSKNEELLDEILLNSLFLFNNYNPMTLKSEELESFNPGFDSIINLVLPKAENPKIFREKTLQIQDNNEKNIIINEDSHSNNLYDNDIETKEDDFENNLRRSIRTVEVIGNIIKNHHGSLTISRLKEMLIFSIEVNLRILGFYFECMKNQELQEYIVKFIESKLNYKNVSKAENIKNAKEILWTLNFAFILSIVYKTIHSIGSDNLVDLISETCNELNTPIASIIKHGISMWYKKNINIKKIKRDFDKPNYSIVAKTIMKFLIILHCSNHKINYKEKQNLINILGIKKDRFD